MPIDSNIVYMDATDKQPNKLDYLVTKNLVKPISDTSQISFSDVENTVSRVDSLNRLVTDYKRIQNDQNGVCNTCVTGFVSVLIEHRTVSKKLSDEVVIMNRNLDRVKAFNVKSLSLTNSYEKQSDELRNTAHINLVSLRTNPIQENNRQVAELRQHKSTLTVSKVLLEKARY